MAEHVSPGLSLGAAAAAATLGLAISTVTDRRWRQRVGLRAFRVGRALRFRERDVLALVEAGLEPVSSGLENGQRGHRAD
jgi:hypothetical protein